MRMQMSQPKVSILILAYNVEKYIAQAIDSVLGQQLDFQDEIYIGNDGSTDGTVEILLDYQKKYPGRIHLHLTERQPRAGSGDYINFSQLWSLSRGEYFTVLDGDDFWIDPLKLKKQIDFLDKNPGFTVCGHNYLLLYPDGTMKKAFESQKYPSFSLVCENFRDLLLGGCCPYMHTSSLVYRNLFRGNEVVQKKMGQSTWYSGDLIRTLMHGEKGKTKYLDEVMSTYRLLNEQLSNSDWNSRKKIDQHKRTVDFFLFHRKYTFPEYVEEINFLIESYCKEVLRQCPTFFEKIKHVKYLAGYLGMLSS